MLPKCHQTAWFSAYFGKTALPLCFTLLALHVWCKEWTGIASRKEKEAKGKRKKERKKER